MIDPVGDSVFAKKGPINIYKKKRLRKNKVFSQPLCITLLVLHHSIYISLNRAIRLSSGG